MIFVHRKRSYGATIGRRVAVYGLELSLPLFLSLSLFLSMGVWPLQSANAQEVASSRDARFDRFEAIPHSTVAQAPGTGIVKAKLACATDRYAHGVLGDVIEGGCLVVENENGDGFVHELPEHHVFEDLVPRIADVDDDGRNDVVLVRSSARGGAALSIYSLAATGDSAELRELAATPEIGTANRWLAPAGIADFNNDGKLDVAYIQTPHIGGILKVWTVIDDKLEQIGESRGYSNHRIGNTRVSTAKIADYNEDGVMDMALPDQRRNSTVWVTLFPEFDVLHTKPYSQADFD
jgi:hypothetical protein